MTHKNRVFFQALAVFLLAIGGAMFVKGVPPHLAKPTPGVVKEEADADTVAKLPIPEVAAEKNRFKHTVPFTVKAEITQSKRWMPGTVGKVEAWRDGKTGLVWSAALDNKSTIDPGKEMLTVARAACAALLPAGAWNLPLSDEMDEAQIGGLQEEDPASRQNWLTYSYAGSYPLPLARAWNPQDSTGAYQVRCVAQSE
jgi:hypothetical protein